MTPPTPSEVPEGGWPPVSIVFLAYNRREELRDSLGHVLEDLDYPDDKLEIIVVDNASTDGTAEMLRESFPAVQLIRNPVNVGASAWNVGMSTARGDWRMILDDDCYITGDALKTAVRAAEQHEADLISFRVLSGVVPDYAFNDEYITGLLTFWGCSAMFSRRAIENEMFYDPNIFIWANEMELTMRLLDRGYRHLFLPEVESVHMKAPNRDFSERATRVNARHFAYIAGKQLQPRDAVAAVLNLAFRVLVQTVSENRVAAKALADIPRGLVTGLRHRDPVRSEVSRIYRSSTWHFASPLATLRSPLDRLRSGAGREEVAASRARRVDRWYARRSRFYPTETATLTL